MSAPTSLPRMGESLTSIVSDQSHGESAPLLRIDAAASPGCRGGYRCDAEGAGTAAGVQPAGEAPFRQSLAAPPAVPTRGAAFDNGD
mmetsp:Transcript_12619/g.32261  ORF Transcript_12619/g.32261 Transcript_12619/m.32261 type:complete len:87 (+) Transcript_12619:161-421(+)